MTVYNKYIIHLGCVYKEKKPCQQWGPQLSRILVIKKSLEKLKSLYMKINFPTQQGFHFCKARILLWWDYFSHVNILSHFAGTFLLLKSMCNIQETHSTKSVIKTDAKFMSFWPRVKPKMGHAATHVENNICSEVEVTFRKDTGKTCF